jgi:hypothetical protein
MVTPQHRDLAVLVETPWHRVTGTLRLPVEGFRSRLTDYLNAHESDFLAITDATVEPLEPRGGEPEKRPFIAVACRHVVLAFELD